MNKKYIVRLSDQERRGLEQLSAKGKTVAYGIRHAHILLKADADGPNWTDWRIAEAFSCHARMARGHPETIRRAGARCGAESKEARNAAAGKTTRRRKRGPLDRAELQQTAQGPSALDAASAGGQDGGTGGSGKHFTRDRAADA